MAWRYQMNIPEVNNSWFLHCTLFWGQWWTLRSSCSVPLRMWLLPLPSVLASQYWCSSHPYFTSHWPQNARVVMLEIRKCQREARECSFKWKKKYNILRHFEGDPIYITFIIVYDYNCSILKLHIIHLLLCLIYKLNFIIVCINRKKYSMSKIQYYLWFQALNGDLGMYTPRIREHYCDLWERIMLSLM